MRELTQGEIDQCAGGNLGAIAVALGGVALSVGVSGAVYWVTSTATGDFSYGGLAFNMGLAAVSGGLVSGGYKIAVAALSGQLPRAALLPGLEMIGLGGATAAAGSVAQATENKDGGS